MKPEEVLKNVEAMIAEGEEYKSRCGKRKTWHIRDVCSNLGIFDWWTPTLSIAQLKQMKQFLKAAISLGFTGYCDFKVGASGYAHGMWAYKENSKTGCSPDGEAIYHSFVSGRNYWDHRSEDGKWLAARTGTNKYQYTLKEIEAFCSGTGNAKKED